MMDVQADLKWQENLNSKGETRSNNSISLLDHRAELEMDVISCPEEKLASVDEEGVSSRVRILHDNISRDNTK